MQKIAKIALMLAVYLVWVCGNSAIALSCHTNAYKHQLCCAEKCDCHHEGCEKTHVETPHGCHHDHSITIALYDTTKKDNTDVVPAEINITAILENDISIEDIATARHNSYFQRKIPLPPFPTITGCGMRAPPVVA
jgi:hypothetical protein